MKLELSTNQAKPNFITKAVLFLIGTLITTLTITLNIQYFDTFGLFIATIILIALCYYGLKTGKKGDQKYWTVLGIIITSLVIVLGFLISVQLINKIKI